LNAQRRTSAARHKPQGEGKIVNRIILRASLIVMLGSTLGIATAQAQTKDIVLKNDIQGYVVDQRNVVVRSGSGLCWRSGSWTPAMAIAECDPDLVKKPAPMPLPAPVAAPAPPPKPVAAPAPPPTAPKVVTIGATELFDFNKAVLKPSAKTEIDQKVIEKLASAGKINLILVGGHTDRLGAAAYNQKLSEKRADAVKAYLVTKGLDGNKIETLGFGKTTPAQGVPKCDDKLPRAKLIACLEPHRRVTIEIQAAAK